MAWACCSSSTSRFLTGLVILSLVITYSPQTCNASVSCTQALEYLMACEPFLIGFGDVTAGSPCCLGARALSEAAASEADRKTVCQCLKQVETIVSVNADKAKQLPQLCKISTPFDIQPSVDCDAIEMRETKLQAPDAPGSSPGIDHHG